MTMMNHTHTMEEMCAEREALFEEMCSTIAHFELLTDQIVQRGTEALPMDLRELVSIIPPILPDRSSAIETMKADIISNS